MKKWTTIAAMMVAGAMIAGPALAASTTPSTANKEQVKAVQEALKDKGVDPGPADGVMGPKTRQALREYQKKEGLKESGTLDSETMSKLGVQKAGAAESTSPSASPSTGATAPPKK